MAQLSMRCSISTNAILTWTGFARRVRSRRGLWMDSGTRTAAHSLWPKPSGTDAIVRTKPFYDEVTPSGNALAAGALWRLGALTDDAGLQDYARKTVQAAGSLLAETPLAAASLLCVADRIQRPGLEIVIAGQREADAARELLDVVRAAFSSACHTGLGGPGRRGRHPADRRKNSGGRPARGVRLPRRNLPRTGAIARGPRAFARRSLAERIHGNTGQIGGILFRRPGFIPGFFSVCPCPSVFVRVALS